MIQPLGAAELVYGALYRRRRRNIVASAPAVHRALRAELDGRRIVSVGNITAGGTGKTPAVQWIVRVLQRHGLRAAVVARGYRGTYSARGAVVADGQAVLLDATQAGDEPVLHARALPGTPIIIGVDRVAAVRLALQRFGPDVIVLDDGFQYWSLPRDLDLVLLDAAAPFGDGHLLPRGRLREPPTELRRAGALLLTRCDVAGPVAIQAARAAVRCYSDAPLFESSHAPVNVWDEAAACALPLHAISGRRVALVSALANNAAFAAAVGQGAAVVAAHLAKRDHYAWSAPELSAFGQRAAQAGADVVLTTEKDAVKISPAWCAPLPLWSLRIELDLGTDAARFETFLLERVISGNGILNQDHDC